MASGKILLDKSSFKYLDHICVNSYGDVWFYFDFTEDVDPCEIFDVHLRPEEALELAHAILEANDVKENS